MFDTSYYCQRKPDNWKILKDLTYHYRIKNLSQKPQEENFVHVILRSFFLLVSSQFVHMSRHKGLIRVSYLFRRHCRLTATATTMRHCRNIMALNATGSHVK